jgi:hypothetical protein
MELREAITFMLRKNLKINLFSRERGRGNLLSKVKILPKIGKKLMKRQVF